MKEYKPKISFSIIWLVAYLIGLLISNKISDMIGIQNLCVVIYRALFVLIMFLYLHKKKLMSFYGISSLKKLDNQALLYYVPLGLLVVAP